MTDPRPLVTILIATKDRAGELRRTLLETRWQQYPSMELLVIDDGSQQPVEPLVRELWPECRVIRHESSAGQCASRNEGFALASGEYILQLDDDCSLTSRGDLAYAVEQLQNQPQAGAISCYIVNSETLPANLDTSNMSSGCAASFVGAAVLFRKAAIAQTAGYRAFFGNEWEEEELGLQLLKRGWRILFVPRIVAHHRLSQLNRNSARTWMRGLRNRVWAIVIHIPFPRMVFEIAWKLSIGAWDAVRLIRGGLFLRALLQVLTGLPRALRLRSPLLAEGLRRYDALRLQPVISPADFDHPPAVRLATFAAFWRRWRGRSRNRSIWDRKTGDTGSSYAVAYAHEHTQSNGLPPADEKS